MVAQEVVPKRRGGAEEEEEDEPDEPAFISMFRNVPLCGNKLVGQLGACVCLGACASADVRMVPPGRHNLRDAEP